MPPAPVHVVKLHFMFSTKLHVELGGSAEGGTVFDASSLWVPHGGDELATVVSSRH